MRYTVFSWVSRFRQLRYLLLVLAMITVSATANAQNESLNSKPSLSDQLQSIANELTSIETDLQKQSEKVDSLNESLSEAESELQTAERHLSEAQASATRSQIQLAALQNEFEALSRQYERLSRAHENLREQPAQTIIELTDERDTAAARARLYRRIAQIGTPAALAAGIAIGFFIAQ